MSIQVRCTCELIELLALASLLVILSLRGGWVLSRLVMNGLIVVFILIRIIFWPSFCVTSICV